ncbi:hypothetical protein LUZ60_002906 [Juncus effusus]|nr:hypothetical protein LUZ60_002906 [Juncus effusus]
MEPKLSSQISFLNQSLTNIGSLSLKCAIELGISDSIDAYGRPMPLCELAQSVSVPPEKQLMLGRVMRLLVQQGVYAECEDGYQLTPFSELILTKGSNFGVFALLMMDPDLTKHWHVMSQWLKASGSNTLFEMANYGKSFWNVIKERPETGNLFDEAMACLSKKMLKDIVACHPQIFDGLKSLIDVGGGIGTTVQVIAEAFPSLKCTVLDLPHVVSKALLSDKFSVVGGDMFEKIPRADAVLLKNVLHDWTDEKCVIILKRCKESISSSAESGGKVIIVDIVVNLETDEPKKVETSLLFDVIMMTGYAAKERSEEQWRDLFVDAGFSGNYKVYSTPGVESLIELFP